MKKVIGIISVSVLMAVCSLAYAQKNQGEMNDQGMMQGDMRADQGMGGSGMMGRGGKRGMSPKGGMMEKFIVATDDGGVIILIGNKLMKYDGDLNLVKEVEMKIDMKAMQKNMAEMMKDCPMMQGGMKMSEDPSDSQSSEQ